MEAYREELAFELVPGEERLVVEGEGVKLCAAVKNPPGAVRGTLFFLHGVASNASRWEEFVETTPLGADWRILRYDLRGHGASVTAEPPVIEPEVEITSPSSVTMRKACGYFLEISFALAILSAISVLPMRL